VRGLWRVFRRAVPWWLGYTALMLLAFRFDDVGLVALCLLLGAGVLLGEAGRRLADGW